MTGVQTCALPICFPVTIAVETQASEYNRLAKTDKNFAGAGESTLIRARLEEDIKNNRDPQVREALRLKAAEDIASIDTTGGTGIATTYNALRTSSAGRGVGRNSYLQRRTSLFPQGRALAPAVGAGFNLPSSGLSSTLPVSINDS